MSNWIVFIEFPRIQCLFSKMFLKKELGTEKNCVGWCCWPPGLLTDSWSGMHLGHLTQSADWVNFFEWGLMKPLSWRRDMGYYEKFYNEYWSAGWSRLVMISSWIVHGHCHGGDIEAETIHGILQTNLLCTEYCC